ncbi:MAG: sulfatase [Phycisphaerales bacterium]
MSRLPLLCMMTLWLGLAGGCESSSRAARRPDAPNIILILADDQGWTGTSVEMSDQVTPSRSDYYRTPHLQRFARDGLRFSQAYAPSPNCSPTRAAIQTGKSPAALHMTDIINVSEGNPRWTMFYDGLPLRPPRPRNALPNEEVTIAERIKAERPEYVTAHFGKWHLGGGGPTEHGYDETDGARAWEGAGEESGNPKDIFGITDSAIEFMSARFDDGRPFFMQVSHFAVHLPLKARPGTIEEYRRRPAGVRHHHPVHAAMTEDLDAGIGRLLGALDEFDLRDETYVIYASDNGAYTVENITNNLPLAKGKASVWEGGIRTPLIIRGPGVPANRICDEIVTGVDLFPTISALIGLDEPLPEGIEGGDLAPILFDSLEASISRSRDEFVWHFPHYQTEKGTTPQSAIRIGDDKLIRLYETGEKYLYDLDRDPGETVNLVERQPELAVALEARLDDYLRAVGAAFPEANLNYSEPETE